MRGFVVTSGTGFDLNAKPAGALGPGIGFLAYFSLEVVVGTPSAARGTRISELE
jgi:hypothetical protein